MQEHLEAQTKVSAAFRLSLADRDVDQRFAALLQRRDVAQDQQQQQQQNDGAAEQGEPASDNNEQSGAWIALPAICCEV